jgi:DNA-binding transcriptional MocR family regulator
MLLYETLADEFAELIRSGHLHAGERLPSVRLLAAQRGLSVSTVVQALRTLECRGLVEARPQSGYYVRGRTPRLIEPVRLKAPSKAVPVGMSQSLLSVMCANESVSVTGFGAALPGPAILPGARLSRLYASLARRSPDLLTTPSHVCLNEVSLQRAITHRALEWGGVITSDEIVITNSCTEAMSLCLLAVTKPGDTVAVESPTYYVMLQLLESMGLRALEIPTHPHTGISVEALELATRNRAVAACLLMSNGGNPLGSLMPDANKQRVVDLLAERNIALIEDDIYGDLCQGTARPRPLYAFDKQGNVMHCTSFSKTLGPSLRLGYILGGRRTADLVLKKTVSSGKTNPLTQRVVAEFINSRGYDAHLRTLRRRYAEQVARTRDAVARYFPECTRITEPQGGLVLWLALDKRIDTTALHQQAIAQGIAFVPGELFSASGQYRHCLRLSCGQPWSDAHDDALRRLGLLAHQAVALRAVAA